MSRGLTDVPMIVVGNKTDLLRRDLASDKFRHDVINKVRDETTFITIPTIIFCFARYRKIRKILNVIVTLKVQSSSSSPNSNFNITSVNHLKGIIF